MRNRHSALFLCFAGMVGVTPDFQCTDRSAHWRRIWLLCGQEIRFRRSIELTHVALHFD